jgi:hypothetical protein
VKVGEIVDGYGDSLCEKLLAGGWCGVVEMLLLLLPLSIVIFYLISPHLFFFSLFFLSPCLSLQVMAPGTPNVVRIYPEIYTPKVRALLL